MIAAVNVAAYVLLDIALSIVVAVVWRTRAVAPADLPPAVRARRLLCLRLVPSVIASLLTIAVVAPAFSLFEPVGLDETMGPALATLAFAGVLQFAIALVALVRALLTTARIERRWLRSASPLDIDP